MTKQERRYGKSVKDVQTRSEESDHVNARKCNRANKKVVGKFKRK